jgi:hypothetical protein
MRYNYVYLKNPPKVDLSGSGGKEKEIIKLFPNLMQTNASLNDATNLETGEKIEFKKIGEKEFYAYLDPRKLYKLSEEDKKIKIICVRWNTKNERYGEFDGAIETTYGDVYDEFNSTHSGRIFLKSMGILDRIMPSRTQLQIKQKFWFTESMKIKEDKAELLSILKEMIGLVEDM